MIGLKSKTLRRPTGEEDDMVRKCTNQLSRERLCGWLLGAFTDASVADVLLPEHTQEAPLAAHVEHVQAAAIGEVGGHCFRAIEQDGDNQGAIHVDLGSYADAVFAKQLI